MYHTVSLIIPTCTDYLAQAELLQNKQIVPTACYRICHSNHYMHCLPDYNTSIPNIEMDTTGNSNNAKLVLPAELVITFAQIVMTFAHA